MTTTKLQGILKNEHQVLSPRIETICPKATDCRSSCHGSENNKTMIQRKKRLSGQKSNPSVTKTRIIAAVAEANPTMKETDVDEVATEKRQRLEEKWHK